MKLTTISVIVFRTFCVVFAVSAISSSSLSQNRELEPVLFDNDFRPIALPLNMEPGLNIDILRQQIGPRWHTMFSQIPNDFARFGNLTVSTQSIPTVASLGLLTISLMETDHHSYRSTRVLYRRSATFHEFSDYAVTLGDGRLHAGIAVAFAGYGLIADDSRALRTASQTVEAFLATGITVQILKRISGRESPICATRNSGRWKFMPHPGTYEKNQPSYYAYPSGHISTAMATLTVIAENYPRQSWIKPVGYTLIGALGVGLVAKGMHWYSDLPLGIALGYVFGKTIANPESSEIAEVSNDGGIKVSVTPSFDPQGGSGVRLAVNF
ncbi:MAG: phosphatase PAP2 family protein [Ignavibacteriales bacterium]|nr:phosphatase PAP2 family protein [Ignavibacteriales bacterium]